MIFSAVFLISAVLFAMELLQTRIFSFSSWNHMTYMVIAVAVMGYAVAGTILAVKKELKNYGRFIRIFSLLFAFSVPFSFFMSAGIPLDPMMPNKLFMIVFLFCDYLFLVLPHFFGGLVLISVFRNNWKNVNISYFFSILGSIAGCFSALPLMEYAGMGGAVTAVSSCAALSAFLIAFAFKGGKAVKVLSTLVLMLALVTIPFKNALFIFRPAPSKFLSIAWENSEMSRWDRAGRVDIAGGDKLAAILYDNPWSIFQRGIITNDGDAASVIYDFSGYRERVAVSLYSAGYFGMKNPDVFVAGLSTTDISAALFWEAKSVTAVEVNKAVIDLNKRKFATFKDNILQDERVSLVHGEVRNFIESSEKKYDLIQLSGTDTVAALQNGAYIMNESYLYTKEAFRSYFEHLTDDGSLSIMRWLLWPPRETLKVAVTAAEVLKEMGAEHPENHIVIIGDAHLASVVVKKRPFTWTEINEMSEILVSTDLLRFVYAPGFSAGVRYYDPLVQRVNFATEQAFELIESGFLAFFNALENGREQAFIENYYFNIEPVSDDNPFFFNYFKLGGEKIPEELKSIYSDSSSFVLIALFTTFAQLLFLAFSIFVTPLFFMSKDEKKFIPPLQMAAFAASGLGFMFVEMTFIQKFTLIFGDPATSAATAIGTMLAFSALGALFGKKILISLGEKQFFSVLAIVLPLMIMGYAVAMPYFTALCAGYSFALKLTLSSLFIFPLGFLAGTVFPVALLLVGEKKPSFIPLAFSADGAASVFATVLSIIIAMFYGFKFVFVLAAFCYFLALSAMLYFVKKRV